MQIKAEVLTKSWRLSWRHVLCCAVGKGVSVHQVHTRYQHIWEETANNCALTARVTERKYYSSEKDFFPASERVTAGQLCCPL